jgi:hypothetical protein
LTVALESAWRLVLANSASATTLAREVSSSSRITIPQDMSDLAREALRDPHHAALPMGAVPWLAMTYDELAAIPLDSRSAFLLSLVDGRCTVEMLLDLSGMDRAHALTLLADLVDRGVLELH